jgi:thymidylate kinase
MNKKPMFICLIGIDGVGKTTHVNLILQYLRNNGIRCEYLWGRHYHFISLPLFAFSRLTGYTYTPSIDGKRICTHNEFYRSNLISLIYPWLLLIDAAIFTITKIKIPMYLGKTIVCDRFVYDTLIDIAISIKDYEIYNKFICELFLTLIPKNAKFIMINLEKSNIFSRRPEIKYDTTFNDRYELYRRFKDNFKIPMVDNSENIGDVNNLLLKTILCE